MVRLTGYDWAARWYWCARCDVWGRSDSGCWCCGSPDVRWNRVPNAHGHWTYEDDLT